MTPNFKTLSWFVFLVACGNAADVRAQERSVSVNIEITRAEKTESKNTASKLPDASNVATWLTPLDRSDLKASGAPSPQKPPKLVQRHKTFEPHVLIVPLGT